MKLLRILGAVALALVFFSCDAPLVPVKSDIAASVSLAPRALPGVGQNIWLLAAANNSYVSADQNLANTQLIANRAVAGGWETFTLIDAGGGLVSLRASNGQYVSADTNIAAYAPLVANRAAVGTWEKFQFIDIGNGQINIKASTNGKFVSADLNRTANLVADRTAAGGWEAFTWGVVGSNPTPTPSPSTGPNPDFGPNVYIFDPSTPASTIQSRANTIFSQQEQNQFGTQRYAMLFKPGTYSVDVNVGFYTQVAGLGLSPDNVNINGAVHAEADWFQGNATQNFWRSVEGLAVTPSGGTNRWAVSQAAPFRRMHIKGNMILDDGGWSSGGFIADSKIDGNINSGGQQQWLTRNTELGSWTGSNWNMVFVGVNNPPSGATWSNPPNTVIAQAPVVREKPFLYVDSAGAWKVLVPAIRTNASGTTWTGGNPSGSSIAIDQFYIAKSGTDSAASINAALSSGKNIILTPGVYHLNDTIRVTRADTVILGLGLATLVPDNGVVAMTVADVDGVKLAGILFDAGTVNSSVLLEVGPSGSSGNHAANPTSLHDLFFRIGGATVGKASVSLRINSNNVIGDHFWIWRADHGNGGTVGWTINTAANGLVVNGADVTIYGLFVEHYQQYQTIWNGNGGRVYFYQSEIPYDPPNQASYMNGGSNGWASYKVGDSVTSHQSYGLGIYCYFNVNPAVKLANAIECPQSGLNGAMFHNMTTVSLGGTGEITHVIDGWGGTANSANQVVRLAQ